MLSFTERFLAARDALASLIAIKAGTRIGSDVDAKKSRLGLEVGFANHEGLVKLLIDKKLITTEEYQQATADAMEASVEAHKS